MNIRATMSEHRTSEKMQAVVKYIGKDKKRYAELMKIFFSDEFGKERRLPMYAAWTMCHVVDGVPHLMQDYWAEMIAHLKKEKLHPTEIRSIVRTWRNQEIPEKYKGTIVEICFQFLSDYECDVAVKVYAMTVLADLIEEYPDLRNEFIAAVEALLENAKPSIKARTRMVFKKIGYTSPLLKGKHKH